MSLTKMKNSKKTDTLDFQTSTQNKGELISEKSKKHIFYSYYLYSIMHTLSISIEPFLLQTICIKKINK